jgi:hypothetical protein
MRHSSAAVSGRKLAAPTLPSRDNPTLGRLSISSEVIVLQHWPVYLVISVPLRVRLPPSLKGPVATGFFLATTIANSHRPLWPGIAVKSMWKERPPNMANRTEPRTVGQWIRYVVVAVIALFLVWWMLRLYVL